MARTVWAVHGTGADITVRTGVHGDIVRGDITDTAVHGTTEDGTDGTTHGITTIIMDGMTLIIARGMVMEALS